VLRLHGQHVYHKQILHSLRNANSRSQGKKIWSTSLQFNLLDLRAFNQNEIMVDHQSSRLDCLAGVISKISTGAEKLKEPDM
jgi:hypothetical protein